VERQQLDGSLHLLLAAQRAVVNRQLAMDGTVHLGVTSSPCSAAARTNRSARPQCL